MRTPWCMCQCAQPICALVLGACCIRRVQRNSHTQKATLTIRLAILGGDRGVIWRRGGIIIGRHVGRMSSVVTAGSVAQARVLFCRAEVRVNAVVPCAVRVRRLSFFGLARLERRTTERASGVATRYARLAHDLGTASQDPRIRFCGHVKA